MKLFYIFFLLILISCQPTEVLENVVFDNSQLPFISINAKNTKIIKLYESKFTDPFIDHSLTNPPIDRLNSWINNNIKGFGSENILEIIILDASLKRIEEEDSEAKKYETKEIYKYEMFFLLEYNLYDDSNYLIASTNVESYRSTTSSRFITLFEKERIIDELILESLIDISNESKNLISEYMFEYI